MTSLFRRLQPRQKFRITLTCIAQACYPPTPLVKGEQEKYL